MFLDKYTPKNKMLGAWQTAVRMNEGESWPSKIGKAIQEVKITNDVLVKERSKARKKIAGTI